MAYFTPEKKFNYIKRAGVTVVELGKKAVRRTIDKPKTDHPVLNKVDYLNAFAKWIGAGGTPLIAAHSPEIGAPFAIGYNYFVLFDP